MATGLTSSLLFVQLASFHFEVDTVVVCPPAPDAHLDRALHFWVEQSSLQFLRLELVHGDQGGSLPQRTEEEEEENVLVFCEDPTTVNQLVHIFGVRQNTVWLVPEAAGVDPPPNLRLDSNWVTFREEERGQEESSVVVLTELYRVKRGRKVLSSHLGTWTESGGLQVPEEDKWKRRADLEGAPIVNTVKNWTPFTVLRDGEIAGLMPEVTTYVPHLPK